MDHKDWHSRGYLPHFDAPGVIQGITYRLWDALPAGVVQALVDDAEMMDDAEKRRRMETYLSAGYGACYLAQRGIAELVEQNWLRFDGERYKLIAWVVMPNHVHVLIETLEGHPLDRIVHSWKSYTAGKANRMLKREGKFWFHDYYDRFIRDEQHFWNAVRYIHENPVKAGLVEKAEDWLYSSARLGVQAVSLQDGEQAARGPKAGVQAASLQDGEQAARGPKDGEQAARGPRGERWL